MTCACLVQSRQITIVSCSASGRGPHSARQEVYGPKGSGKRSFAAQIAIFAAFPTPATHAIPKQLKAEETVHQVDILSKTLSL